jgi:hypothetical protein
VKDQTRRLLESIPSNVYGAGRRIRTDDLLITNQLLYQLSYAGAKRAELSARGSIKQASSPQARKVEAGRFRPKPALQASESVNASIPPVTFSRSLYPRA